jgi:hypothetical protein
MRTLKLKLIFSYFRIKPGIKNKVSHNRFPPIMKRFKDQYDEIDARIEKEKGIMAFHRVFLIIGLALYKALQDEFQDQETLIDKVHDILCEGFMFTQIRLSAIFIRLSRDPFRRFLKVLGPNNEWFFPCPPWEKVSVEIQNGVGWHQRKCPMVDFFESEGVVELTRAYCDMDIRVAELLPNHIVLKREHAMCKGDDYCDFLYYRK